ncbi:MAG TPA: tripartite tricarboxylate transporter substrate binding protein [Xanthobacteraceae bacterium]|nr:tripartite tricarboxylate transporter substrate binding protein [Xanthobacteraceae bacterium]
MPKTSRRQFLAATSAVTVSAFGLAKPAIAQQWPAQDIHFVTGSAAGSGGDIIVRHFQNKIRPMTTRNIIVENRAGAGGNIAIEYVARAKPDGYTILLWGGNAIAGMMSLLKNPPIDTAKTMQLCATINRQAFMFVVDAKSPYKTIDELTKAMLAKGEKASYATNTVDATVMGEIYKAKTGVKAVEVTYKTAADTINDMASGAVDYAVHNPVLALGQHREGKMRILGVGSNERLQSLPDLPTMTEQGIPMNVIGWWAATVPAGTPKIAVDTINKWFVDAVSSEDTKKFLNNLGGDTLITTPEQAQAMMLKDIENWREYVKIAKIVPLG